MLALTLLPASSNGPWKNDDSANLHPQKAQKGSHMPKRLFLTFLLLTVFAFHFDARAQDPPQPPSNEPAKIELGVHLSSITLGPQISPFFDFPDRSRTEAGLGVRFGYNLNRYVAVEAEGDFFPHRMFPQLNSGGTLAQGQFGVKTGKRFKKFGLFAKARPGFVTFGEILTQTGTVTFPFQGNGPIVTFPIFEERRRNFFSMDVGAVVELYPSRGILVRFDLGDTMIHYGDTPVVPFSDSPGLDRVSHKFQFSAGIGFRYLNPETTDQTDFQTPDKERKLEIGAQFTSLNLRETSEAFTTNRIIETFVFGNNNQSGVGARIGYNITPHISAEVQGDYYPGDIGIFFGMPAGGRTFQIQAGPKFGKRFEKFGVFAKARPGVISFSNTFIFDGFEPPPFFILQFHFGRVTHFSLDAGGVLEFYATPRLFARFDCGDTMIRYGPRLLGFFPTPMKSPSTVTHNLQLSAGVGFRF
jgi:hypothetical protein